jgi:DNA-binding SARP family transcriptional activator
MDNAGAGLSRQTEAEVQVRILGPLEISVDGRRVTLGGGRQRALLAILALNRNQVVSSDRLIDELWRASPPATAAKGLQNLVAQLRRSLAPCEALVTQEPGYLLQLDDDAIDAVRFEHLVVEGRRALASDPGRAADRLGEALTLWRGEALVDSRSFGARRPRTGSRLTLP